MRAQKWELCRGIGNSFGYNRNEAESDMLSGTDLIALLVDVTAKNGNLLIDVGPDAKGAISELLQRPLKALGAVSLHHWSRPVFSPTTLARRHFFTLLNNTLLSFQPTSWYHFRHQMERVRERTHDYTNLNMSHTCAAHVGTTAPRTRRARGAGLSTGPSAAPLSPQFLKDTCSTMHPPPPSGRGHP